MLGEDKFKRRLFTRVIKNMVKQKRKEYIKELHSQQLTDEEKHVLMTEYNRQMAKMVNELDMPVLSEHFSNLLKEQNK